MLIVELYFFGLYATSTVHSVYSDFIKFVFSLTIGELLTTSTSDINGTINIVLNPSSTVSPIILIFLSVGIKRFSNRCNFSFNILSFSGIFFIFGINFSKKSFSGVRSFGLTAGVVVASLFISKIFINVNIFCTIILSSP